LANLVLHALSAYLLLLILKRLSVPGAWLAARIFALHPICVESVAWISKQKNTLSTVFYLSSAMIYLDFDEKEKVLQFRRPRLFVLALLSKSVTATLPAALLVILCRRPLSIPGELRRHRSCSWGHDGGDACNSRIKIRALRAGSRARDFHLVPKRQLQQRRGALPRYVGSQSLELARRA
jgi:hypothetical protein